MDKVSSSVDGSGVVLSSLTSAAWSAIKGVAAPSSVTRLSIELSVLFNSLLTSLSHCSADITQVCRQTQEEEEINSKTAWHRDHTSVTHLQPSRRDLPPTAGTLSSALTSSHVLS